MATLDASQQQAVISAGHTLISACPGSGKTRVLSVRAARLLDQISSGRLVAVTFTRDAAKNLRSRILGQSGKSPARRLITGTFHSLALMQYRRAGQKIQLISEGEQYTIVRQVWNRTPEIQSIPIEEAMSAIDGIKSTFDPPPSKDTPIGILFHAYQDSLESLGVYDFSGLLIQSVIDMRAGELPLLPANWLLVDEAQDADAIQMAWIDCYAKAGAEVTIVADDDQSIYGWRNALGYQGLEGFRKNLNAKHLYLENNYRCAPEIVEIASRLIAFNRSRVEKAIRPQSRAQGKVELRRVFDRWEEGQLIAREIDQPGKWAVLARTNRLLDPLELSLRAADIPCRRVEGKSIWARPEAAVMMGLLRSVSSGDPSGNLLALNWAGIPGPFLGKVRTSGDRWFAAIEKLVEADEGRLDEASKKLIFNFLSRCKEWEKACRFDRVRLVVAGVANWCRSQETRSAKAKIFDWCEEILNRLSGNLASRLNFLMRELDDKDNVDAVILMTLHNSKGLEFPNVWIAAVEEGVLPHVDSALEEERRLCYVGITRAEQRLVLSYATNETRPSRFLSEAGLLQN